MGEIFGVVEVPFCNMIGDGEMRVGCERGIIVVPEPVGLRPVASKLFEKAEAEIHPAPSLADAIEYKVVIGGLAVQFSSVSEDSLS